MLSIAKHFRRVQAYPAQSQAQHMSLYHNIILLLEKILNNCLLREFINIETAANSQLEFSTQTSRTKLILMFLRKADKQTMYNKKAGT